MKRTKQNSKLKLGKEVVSSLTRNEQRSLQGGEPQWTTSFGDCSGFLCCNPTGLTKTYSQVFKCLEEEGLAPQ
ncbi:class I lanthipeptide [Taibaiella helva]|uniref:class I lanthipeptide n=1 Tax=Taibaiella helva TaxID=2301235 RepID=UPI00130031A7|nr:class I lanthipeptide [Taibaiella helva]